MGDGGCPAARSGEPLARFGPLSGSDPQTKTAGLNRSFGAICLNLRLRRGGNPGGRLIRLQLRSCVDLLLREIELFQPGLLLFVTGAWWLDPKEYGRPTFAEALELTLPASEGRPEHVVATGEYRGAKVIVCNRPEGRSESGFVQAVLACC